MKTLQNTYQCWNNWISCRIDAQIGKTRQFGESAQLTISVVAWKTVIPTALNVQSHQIESVRFVSRSAIKFTYISRATFVYNRHNLNSWFQKEFVTSWSTASDGSVRSPRIAESKKVLSLTIIDASLNVLLIVYEVLSSLPLSSYKLLLKYSVSKLIKLNLQNYKCRILPDISHYHRVSHAERCRGKFIANWTTCQSGVICKETRCQRS